MQLRVNSYLSRLSTLGILLVTLIFLSSCRDDFETSPSTGNLLFSRDTVYLDTVFSSIGSSTYTLKVYNTSDNAIHIPSIRLDRGEQSQYRLNVDGIAGKQFEDIEILANDSIFIFIETTIDYNQFQNEENNFLYTDAIAFDQSENQQKVALVTLVQDAHFLFPQRDDEGMAETLNLGIDENGNPITIEGFILDDDELLFTNEKPYVIYGYAAVQSEKTLHIEQGSRLHFHENSGLLIGNRAHLEVNGTLSTDQDVLENEVIFEGDRLEPEFSDIAGQWGAVWLTSGSTASINYLTIKNATVGLLVDTGTAPQDYNLKISNTQIYNSSNVGLYALNSSIQGENVIVNNAGISSLWLRLGGRYDFVHSTFTNYFAGFRDFPAVQIDNFIDTNDDPILADLQQASFTNSIIYGNELKELQLSANEDAAFNFSFTNVLLRYDDSFTTDSSALFDFNNENLYKNITLNEDPNFRNSTKNDLRIPNESSANGQGNSQGTNRTPIDILGVQRATPSDLGAYESTTFENEQN